MNDRNPYEDGSPHWQLFENMISQRRLEIAFIQDAERAQQKAKQARKRGDEFEAALNVLKTAQGEQQ